MATQSTPSEEAVHARSRIQSRAAISRPVDVAASTAMGAPDLTLVVDTGDLADDVRMTGASVVERVIASNEVTAQDVRDACIAPRTQHAYAGSLRARSRWIVSIKSNEASSYFDRCGQINLDRFTVRDFEDFLVEKRKTVGISTLNGYRSAVKDLYRRKEIPLPTSYKKSMSTFFSGLKRLQASEHQAGAPRESGKDSLPYSIYQDLCKSTLLQEDGGFSHFVLTTQWNLMSRSESAQTICTEHLSAHDDSIGCVIQKSKTNQEGSGPKDPRRIYANPFNPATCWITSLAMFLACRPTQQPGPLLLGSQQKARFGTALRQLMVGQSGLNHVGTHSIRKGVATFACSGTTGGSSIASVCLRVGWSLGGVQDRYIRYESAGDQYLGRVVTGLPHNSAVFAVLPPHFENNQDSTLCKCVAEMFPALKNDSPLQDILKLCIGSLVFHANYLRATLPISHPLLSTFLFRHDDHLEQLRSKLGADTSSWMIQTGIPPHVELYKQLKSMKSAIGNLPPVLLEGIGHLIEEKGVAAGNITKDQLESTIERLLVRAGMARSQTPTDCPDESTSTAQPVHYYDGKFHLLPKFFEFPKTGPFGAWKLWWFGDNHIKYPPFKSIRSHDLPSKRLRKMFSDWGVPIRHIKQAAEATGSAVRVEMSEQEAAEIFRVGMANLHLTGTSKTRRVAELSVTTVLRLRQQPNGSVISSNHICVASFSYKFC